jgi:methanogenic corrinoid protein MtbC1
MHEIGLLCASTALRASGWHNYHLGANVPVKDLCTFVRERNVKLVCLSTGSDDDVAALRAQVAALRDCMEDGGHLQVVLGGRVTDSGLNDMVNHASEGIRDLLQYTSALAAESTGRTGDR